MMKKLFHKKIAKVYIALICFTLISGVVSMCFCIHFSSEFKEMTAEKKPSGSELLTTVASAIGGDGEATDTLTDMLASALTDAVEGETQDQQEEKLSAEEKKVQNLKILTLVLMILFYVLCVASSAATITCYQYEKYLESPKYKAKLKRMSKYEKQKAK